MELASSQTEITDVNNGISEISEYQRALNKAAPFLFLASLCLHIGFNQGNPIASLFTFVGGMSSMLRK